MTLSISGLGSVNGSGAGSSLVQMTRLFSQAQAGQTTDASAPSTSDTSATDTSAGDLVAELQSFFQGALSPETMGGLLQAQGGQVAQQGASPGGGGEAPSLSDIDSDGNGSISKTEFESFGASKPDGTSSTSKADVMFSKMDTNGDGSVSADEKTAFDKTMQSNRPSGPPPGPPPSGQASGSSDGTSIPAHKTRRT
ncbi:MAG: EF-hand domain-containing protein [Asticcacaulis sp.]|nr:EF-hand domain-containing protein [Asticcacaulis sp.]